MATWVIGDVQGCDAELGALLAAISFERGRDTLWFAGDLVNRGPASLAVLRRVYALRDAAIVVLGNHDLHLLACRWGARKPSRKDTLAEVLAAPDCDRLCTWLRGCPLLHVDPAQRAALVHAGIAPGWDVTTAQACAAEVEQVLRGPDFAGFLADMYGDQPERFDAQLTGVARLRAITNSFTRMRVCHPDGRLDLKFKRHPRQLRASDTRRPWYELSSAWPADMRILFGHWAALGAIPVAANIEALDSGCVWGGALTALCLDSGEHVAVASQQPAAAES